MSSALFRVARRFGAVFVVALALLALGASRFGVTYELAQYQLREHPETWMLVDPGSDDAAFRRMRTNVVASGTVHGTRVELERFEERPILLLTAGATTWLVASSNYAHLLLQNLDLLARPWLGPPWDARFFSVALGVAYLALVRALTRAALGQRVAHMTTCLVMCNAFYLWEFGSGHTHVVGTLVLFGASLWCLLRSLSGSRAWLAAAFALLVFALSAKITATGYLVAVGLTLLWRTGVRAELRTHRAQWLTAAAAVVVAWSLLLAANALFMTSAFYASDGKLMGNLGRVSHAPWEIARPVVHQLGILVAAPVAYLAMGAPFSVALLLVPLCIYLAGAAGVLRARRGLERNARAFFLCNALLLGEAGIFYFRDASFDLQLLALPMVIAVLVRGVVSLVPEERPWEGLAVVFVAALSGVGSVFAICAIPLYGFTIGIQKDVLRALNDIHPSAVITVDPTSTYPLKWLEPRLPIVYFQGAHQQLRHAPDREILPALRAFLQTRHADAAIVPERPIFEMPRDTPWAAVRAVFDGYFGLPRLVRDGTHDGVLVYHRPVP